MKRICTTMFFSLLLTIGSWASNSYNKYEVANVELAQAIDSVMERANKMEYFSVLDNPYMIRIFIQDTLITIRAMPYSITLITNGIQNIDDNRIGAGMYKDKFFLVTDMSRFDKINQFFRKVNGKQSCPLHPSPNLIDQNLIFYHHILEWYDVKNNHLFLNEDDGIEASDKCFFIYECKWYDNWRSIARKSHCPVIMLKNEYKQLKRPIKGYLFHFQYIIKNNKLKSISTIL